MGGRGSSIGVQTGGGRKRATGWDGYIGEKGYRQVGSIEGHPIVEDTWRNNGSQPIYSSTPNAIYFTKKQNEVGIYHISYYNKKGELYRSVDLKEKHGMHAHQWDIVNGKAMRIAHNKKYDSPLTNRDKHYIKLAEEYERQKNR